MRRPISEGNTEKDLPRRTLLLGSFSLPLLFTSPAPTFASVGTKVDRSAPDFDLPAANAEGKKISLKDLASKYVVLYFYPADFSSGCTLEANRFQLDLPKYKDLNTVVLGVSVDDIDHHRDFCGKNKLTFPLLSDVDGKVSFAYGTLLSSELGTFADRQTFLIDPKGKIVFAWKDVSPLRHSDEVIAELEKLQGVA